jgi:hypothetical protein
LIELSRALVRQFRAVVRKSVQAADPRGPCPMVVCRAGRRGLTLTCRQGKVGARHHTPGSFRDSAVAVPFSKLAELEGTGGVVALEQTAPLEGRASWQGDEGPRVLEFDTADPSSLPTAPEPGRNSAGMGPEFLKALDDAARTASRESVRFATNRISLRGRDGSVVATDGRQLLLQGGFRFPWKGEQYLPAVPVFGERELPRDRPVGLGLSKDRVTLEVGPWLLDFGAEQGARFPDVDKVIPDAGVALTRLRLDAGDIEALVCGLPRLPCDDDQHRPVTLDLGATVAVRSRSGEGDISEVVLAGSKREGPPRRVAMDRRYLLRALKLGFTEVLIASATQPVFCKDASRTYLWMPLGEADAVPAGPAPRAGPARAIAPPPAARPETPRRTPAVPPNIPPNGPRPDGEHRNGSAGQGEPLDPIAEAEELRVALQSALTRIGRLLAALKQQRRQSRVVETALASLRLLQ